MTTTHLYRSIHAQPAAINALLADEEMPVQAAQRLARTSGRILLVGIGTSYHAALVGEYLLRSAGAEAWALRSFEFVNYPRPLLPDDTVIVISHRGSKQYSALAVERAREASVTVIGMSGKNASMQGVDLLVETVEQDPSSAHSISYTGALTRLAQISMHLAKLQNQQQQALSLAAGLAQIPTLMQDLLTRENDIQQIAQEAITQQRRLYFVGTGPNTASAPEGALKAKETAYVTAEGLELEQALHGPLVSFEAHDLLIPIGVKGAAQSRVADFLLAADEIGTRVWLLGEAPGAESAALFQREGWARFPLTDTTDLPEVLTPLLAALPLQLLAHFLAAAAGTNADSFRLEHDAYQKANSRIRL